jgi:predicted O-methyltransferase YrrM
MSVLLTAPSASVAKRKMRTVGRRLKWRVLSELFKLPAIRLDSVASAPRLEVCEPIVDDLCMPPIPGGPGHDDLGAVLRIARSCRPQLICEIGTAHGNLTANLLRNCPGAKMVTVNAPAELQSGNSVTYTLTPSEIGRVYRRYGYDKRVLQLLVNSLDLDLGQHVEPCSIDLAIVDGCHDTEFVLNDFGKLRPYVRPDGVVLFHDTNPSQEGHLAGSYRACLLLRKDGFDVKWIRNTWWGYWQKGPK